MAMRSVMKQGLLAVAATCVVSLLSACQSAPAQVGSTETERTDEAERERTYAFVFIRTGPLREPTEAQSREAMQGHFANMQRLAAEETLLIAGPLAEPKSDPSHRGIFVFDADTAEKGLAIANGDPAAQMGVFVMEPYTLATDAPLTELPRLEREYEQRRLADPDVPDEWVGRLYVMATTPYSKPLHEQLDSATGVLVCARLLGADGSDRLLLWLDAASPRAAAALLPDGRWTYHGWYGSPTIAELAGL